MITGTKYGSTLHIVIHVGMLLLEEYLMKFRNLLFFISLIGTAFALTGCHVHGHGHTTVVHTPAHHVPVHHRPVYPHAPVHSYGPSVFIPGHYDVNGVYHAPRYRHPVPYHLRHHVPNYHYVIPRPRFFFH